MTLPFLFLSFAVRSRLALSVAPSLEIRGACTRILCLYKKLFCNLLIKMTFFDWFSKERNNKTESLSKISLPLLTESNGLIMNATITIDGFII